MRPIEIKFRLDGPDRSLDASVQLPREPLRPVELLPVLLSLSEAVVSIAEARVAESGETISCRAGCGACCRQLVPISEPEALHLSALVAAMPEPRQSEVRERFREARLRAAPVLESPILESMDMAAAAWPYFALGIACPFLENESCGIHQQRPSICREYLVVSAPEHCAKMDAENVRRVTVPAPVSTALMHFSDGRGTEKPRAMPLIHALEFTDDAQPQIPGPELFQNFLKQLG
ncbi:MAG TPA: YkgJ family cysteine cluster protein [Bryobacteraceae bacterium]|jgi:Fe-S-cluster containining protein